MPQMPRIQEVVMPILRAAPALQGVTISSWVADIDYRKFPMINIRRIGGARLRNHPTKLSIPTIEMTCYGIENLIETERMYDDALEALYEAVRTQQQTPKGYLHSIREPMGMTQFSSPFQDSWRVQGLIALGQRPPK
ncbi:tail terminator [Gordonia phage Anon]|nr:tail terminator [Gordonia phage Anon]